MLIPLWLLACAPDPCTGYIDADGDGFGEADARFDCDARAVAVGGDCDDADAGVFPGADEVCNGLDDDCDARVDEDAVVGIESWVDADEDGYGAGVSESSCEVPEGRVTVDGDCDDEDDDRFPGAQEVCDGVDQDCDDVVDDDSVDVAMWYADDDEDGYGDPARSEETCPGPAGWVLNMGDCDDADPDLSPLASELCDGIDNDCSGVVDEYPVDGTTWYPDRDEDGYGSDSESTTSCEAPDEGYVGNDEDCDDRDDEVHPGATDLPGDSEDTDCDGFVTCYADYDGDGYGRTSLVSTSNSSCSDSGESSNADDCDDTDDAAYPSAPEVLYDGVDQDCDGLDSADADFDGFDALEAGGTDCDDTDRSVNPDAAERCDADGVDDDCDGLVNAADPDLATTATWYTDADGDGWGDDALATEAVCAPPSGVADPGDCDDADPEVHPFAAEDCTAGVDANCDGSVGAVDADGDGVVACEDCDDRTAGVRPGAAEVAANRGDDDCDGLIDEYVGDVTISMETEAQGLCAGWSSVEGNLDLVGLDSLRDLDCLRAVSGHLRVSDVQASDLDGLELLVSVGGDMLLGGWQDEAGLMVPSAFTSLDGLDRLRNVGGDLWVAENGVTDLGGLARLWTVGESVVLWDLPISAVPLPISVLGDDLWLESLPALDHVSAPALTSHGGSLWLQSLAQTSGSFSLEWPVAVGGRLGLVDLPDGVAAGWSLPDTVGALTVSGTALSTLDGLEDLRFVQGTVLIEDNTDLADVWGLDGLEAVGGDMSVSQVGGDADAFSSLRSVSGWLRIAGSHTGVSGFGALEQVGEGLSLSGVYVTGVVGFGSLVECPSLEITSLRVATDLSGLEGVAFSRDVTVLDVRTMPDVAFLSGVSDLSGELSITSSAGLLSLGGLEGLRSVGGAVTIAANSSLVAVSMPALTTIGGALTLQDLNVLSGLDLGALQTVGGDVALEELDGLPDLRGFGALQQVGGLWISELNAIADLDGLGSLENVEGSLIIERLPLLTSFTGLEGLVSVGQDLQVYYNSALVDLDGLTALQSVGRDLSVISNASLVRPVALGELRSIGRDLWVESNRLLVDLVGLGTFTVGNTLWMVQNESLESVEGLDGLVQVPENLVFADLPRLSTVGALGKLQTVGGELRIGSCPLLIDLVGLDALTQVGGSLEIGDQRSWPGWGGGNAGLVSLDGLGGLQAVGSDLWIRDDAVLVDISALGALTAVGGDLGIMDNPSLLTTDADELAGRVSVVGTVYVSGNL